MRTRISFFSLLAVLTFIAGCFKGSPEPQPCTYDPCAYKVPPPEIAAVQAYLDSAGITGATQHCSGLFYKIEASGTGKTPEVCDNSIVAKYKGLLTNGNVFDSGTFQRAFYFDELIHAWANGIPLIKEGGKITMYVPPSLGYGNRPVEQNGTVVIPANSIIIFDAELLTVN